MTEGRCDFCGSNMDAVGGLFSAPRASICLGCAQSAVDALQGRTQVALTGVTSLQLPAGSVITTPLAQPVAVAQPITVAQPAAARRGGINITLDSRTVAKVVVIALAALLLSRRRR